MYIYPAKLSVFFSSPAHMTHTHRYMRFQVVSAPLDTKIQETLTQQLQLSLKVVADFTKKKSHFFTTANRLLTNEEFLIVTSKRAAQLLSPKSLPGSLLIIAIMLRIIHYFLLRRYAAHAVRTQHNKHNKNNNHNKHISDKSD